MMVGDEAVFGFIYNCKKWSHILAQSNGRVLCYIPLLNSLLNFLFNLCLAGYPLVLHVCETNY